MPRVRFGGAEGRAVDRRLVRFDPFGELHGIQHQLLTGLHYKRLAFLLRLRPRRCSGRFRRGRLRQRPLRQSREQRIPAQQRARLRRGLPSRRHQPPGGVDLEAQPVVRPPGIAARKISPDRPGVFLGEVRREGRIHPPERQPGTFLPRGERAGFSLAALQLERGVGDPAERAEQDRERRGKAQEQGSARSHARRHPRPRTVSRIRGSPASSRSFFRRRATVMSAVRVSIRRGSISQTRTNSSSRGTSRPSAAIR